MQTCTRHDDKRPTLHLDAAKRQKKMVPARQNRALVILLCRNSFRDNDHGLVVGFPSTN